jgi:hypothetical protein
MTAVLEGTWVPQHSSSLGPILQAAHEMWIDEAETYLTPIIVPEASFWDRLTAVRYIADQFARQYRRESALLQELRPLLDHTIAEHLISQGRRVAQLWRELDRVGRRRGTSRTVAVTARALVEALQNWCRQIEAAAGAIPREALPDEAKGMVETLELHLRTQP